jgi:transcriptional regulator with XRE-family HTH domain
MQLQDVGQRIRTRREELGITQVELSRRMGRKNNAAYISEIENGKRDIGVQTLNRAAVALNCTPADFLTFELVKSNKFPDPETFANLATAQAEHRLLTDMALETARLEIAPETTTALERLRELVRVQGKRNQYGHKQYKNIILNGGLLELTDDEPEVISETRAAQILEGA